ARFTAEYRDVLLVRAGEKKESENDEDGEWETESEAEVEELSTKRTRRLYSEKELNYLMTYGQEKGKTDWKGCLTSGQKKGLFRGRTVNRLRYAHAKWDKK
ncbi:hypothetical protein K501DRAFT_273432, partial [Backusella circina FSU 941]